MQLVRTDAHPAHPIHLGAVAVVEILLGAVVVVDGILIGILKLQVKLLICLILCSLGILIQLVTLFISFLQW